MLGEYSDDRGVLKNICDRGVQRVMHWWQKCVRGHNGGRNVQGEYSCVYRGVQRSVRGCSGGRGVQGGYSGAEVFWGKQWCYILYISFTTAL